MTPTECMRIFYLHKELLLVYESNEAVTWLMTPRTALGDRRPCESLSTVESYHSVLALVRQLTEGAHV